MRYPAAILAVAAAAVGTAAVLAAPAAATEAVGERIAVTYSDLDLATKTGQQTLDRRIDRAARNVCHMDDLRTGRATPPSRERRCYTETMHSVHDQVAELIARRDRRG